MQTRFVFSHKVVVELTQNRPVRTQKKGTAICCAFVILF